MKDVLEREANLEKRANRDLVESQVMQVQRRNLFSSLFFYILKIFVFEEKTGTTECVEFLVV